MSVSKSGAGWVMRVGKRGNEVGGKGLSLFLIDLGYSY